MKNELLEQEANEETHHVNGESETTETVETAEVEKPENETQEDAWTEDDDDQE